MELNKCSEIAQEKLTLTRRELQEVMTLTSTLTTQLGIMLTSKDDLLINSFSIKVQVTLKSPFINSFAINFINNMVTVLTNS